MSHANIVKYFHYFEDGTNVYIILELCSNKSLNDMVRARKRLTEPEARFFISELLGALDYMHNQNIIHRDLKLGNLFLNDAMHLKVGDFGLATELTSEDERKKTICGTPNYIAPEILNSALGHSFEVDIWATGIILYTMLVGRPPFQTKDVDRIYAKIKEVSYEFPDSVRISDEARDLIAAILQSQPETRPSIQQIRFHPFFTAPMPKELPVSALTTPPVWPSSVAATRNETDSPRAVRTNSAVDVPARAVTAPQLRHPWSVTAGPSSSSNAAAAAASEASARQRIEAAREQALAERQQQRQASSARPEPPRPAPTAPSSLDPPAPAPPSAPSTWSRSTAVHASSGAHDHERAASPTLVAGPAAAATAVGTTARTLRRARSEQWLPTASTNAAAAAVAPAAEATMRQSTVARSASTTTTASASDMSPRTTARVVTTTTRANSAAAPLASSSATYYPDDTVVPTRPSPSSRAAIATATDSRRRAVADLAASRSGSHHSGSSSSTISSMSSTAPDHPPPPAAMADLARDEYSTRAMRIWSPRSDLDPVRRELATPAVTAAVVAAQSQRMLALSLDSPGRVRAREVARDESGSGELTAAKLRAAAAAGRASPAMTRSVQGPPPVPAPARGYDREYDLRRDAYHAAQPARASPQSMAVDRAMSYDVQDVHRLTRSTSMQLRSNSSPVVSPSSSSAAAGARATRYAPDDRLAAYLPPSPRTKACDAKDEYRTSPLGHEVPRSYDAPRASYEAAPISHEVPRSYEPPRSSDCREPDPSARDKYRAMAYDRVPPAAPAPVPSRADKFDVDYERARNEAYDREYDRAKNKAYDHEYELATDDVYDREDKRVGVQVYDQYERAKSEVYDQYERTRPESSSAAAGAREYDCVRSETAPREYGRSRPEPVASREYERARPETAPREYDRDRTRYRDDEYSRSAVVPPVLETMVVADRASSSLTLNERSSPMSAPVSGPTRTNGMATAATQAPASVPAPAAAPATGGSGGPHMMDTMARNLALAWQCAHDTSALATIRLEALRVGADVPPPTVFIVKFIDYSNKYGLGYQLSNGVVGVYFNDTTLLVLAPDGHHFEYLYSCRTDTSMPGVMKRQAHTMTQYPPDLAKKVTLLHHFREYMNQNMAQGAAPSVPSTPTTAGGDTTKTADLEFLIKYYKTAAAVVFRLSNQVVQVNFQDHTKMVLANDARLVAYIDQYRQVHQFQLADLPVLRARASLASVAPATWPPGTDAKEVHMAEALLQRLRYTKDLVDNMRTKRRRQQQQQQQQTAQ
ncbi:PLK protein kinase, variant [Allomyces macrogynus ATCC 38327]|nr:PLK protein kinase, variant [Allomyces macrogynus ATCC 38327]|eukprot:KNE68931.1 PLK protein kinase, variant [Allomyces macrogynus ATCC 38327]